MSQQVGFKSELCHKLVLLQTLVPSAVQTGSRVSARDRLQGVPELCWSCIINMRPDQVLTISQSWQAVNDLSPRGKLLFGTEKKLAEA